MGVPLYCSNIRNLTLMEVNTWHLKGSDIWKSIGNNLEMLILQVCGPLNTEINKIQSFCRRLKVIDIDYVCF